jgi:tripartite-type tricarboxylate transporter receptor subunit TctC
LLDISLKRPAQGLEPISGIPITAFALAVHPSVPVDNLNELIVYAKANPGKMSYGSAGTGSWNHFTVSLHVWACAPVHERACIFFAPRKPCYRSARALR